MAKYVDPERRCIATGKLGVDLHHVRSRGAGGSDEPHNLMPVSHKVHQYIHQVGLREASAVYPGIKDWLLKNGWRFDYVLLRWDRDSGL